MEPLQALRHQFQMTCDHIHAEQKKEKLTREDQENSYCHKRPLDQSCPGEKKKKRLG